MLLQLVLVLFFFYKGEDVTIIIHPFLIDFIIILSDCVMPICLVTSN